MSHLPSGTLTFLYTDIEGSTTRWEEHPEAMKIAVERHDAILQGAIEGVGGVIFRRMGDAFCACFVLASEALSAVLSAQRALAVENWDPRIAPIKVRMALHTGPGEVRDGDYVGPHLNRIARLLSTGYGGQTLLTQATHALVCDLLPGGVSMRDLGEHRLKDLQRPEQIFQLVSDDIPSDFPPLKTLDTHPNNLPIEPTNFIGRETEIEQAQDLLSRPQVRLVTFTGPGGMGKTRLSLQVAAMMLDRFQDGVYFVPLTTISDQALVPRAIAEVVGIMESGGRSVMESLKDFFKQKDLLLVLDNFEQVLGASRVVAELLSVARRLKALITSREVLHIYGEQEFPVAPLQLPDPRRLPPLESLARYESVRLFIERATSVKPGFELADDNATAIAEICVRLDGLPLAIELAAARVKLLTPQAILSRLESRLKVLTGGARDLPARQQTLRGAIDWSHDLLSPEERTLFRRMSVFVGGCDVEAAEAVCDPAAGRDPESTIAPLEIDVFDGLASLVDKSLLRQVDTVDGASRFVMLETIREYALERSEESGERAAICRSHAYYYLALAERCGPLIQTPRLKEAMQKLDAEHDNLRAVLEWGLSDGGEKEIGLRTATALYRYWHIKGQLMEGRQWMEALLPGVPERTKLRANALYAAGYMIFLGGDGPAGCALLEECAAISREIGDELVLAYAFHIWGAAMAFEGDQEGIAINSEGVRLFRQLGAQGKPGLVLGLLTSGMLAMQGGDYSRAGSIFEECKTLSSELGDAYGLAQSSNYLGDIARIECDYTGAESLYGETLQLVRAEGFKSDIPAALHNIGYVVLAQGDHPRAEALFKESLALHQEIGNKQGIGECLTGFAALAGALGDTMKAARLFGASEALRSAMGTYMWPAERIEWERQLASARSQSDEAQWDKAWREGSAMTMEAAIEYALRGG